MAKGSDYERKICKMLSLWWTNGAREDIYWRTAGSGARGTMRSKKGKDTFGQYGDVTAVDPVGLDLLKVFTIELKRGYNNENLFTILDKKSKTPTRFEKFYHQVIEDMDRAKSMSWMLIWRRDYCEAMVYISRQMAEKLYRAGAERLTLVVPYMMGRVTLKNGRRIGVYTCTLENFLDAVRPNNIKGVIKNGR